MTDAGFFRGTSSDQDNRFANKQKKLLKELNFSPILATKLNMSKINIESLKPWIETKIKDVLEKDDELLSESIYEHLAEKEPDGRNLLVLITGFVEDTKASKFMENLWAKLIDLQESSNGATKTVNDTITDAPKSDLETKDNHAAKEANTQPDKLTESSNSNVDNPNKDSQDGHESSGSSSEEMPPSRSVSKSPGHHKLDERSRGRPRRRLHDDSSSSSEGVKSRSRGGSASRSGSSSGSVEKQSPGHDSTVGAKRKSRSGSSPRRVSRSPRSRSITPRHSARDDSKSHSTPERNRLSRRGRGSRSRTRSRSRSRSRSRGYRGPRSRSPRSPRGRRGYAPRGPYRGSMRFHDRRRGGIGGGTMRRRQSPSWGRRRFSPRSPMRRRRSPTFSPRRRRSPSPYSRRISRSRSPIHTMGRGYNSPRPRTISGGGHLDHMGGRHMSHHDMHRPMGPIGLSPRGHMSHRGLGDSHLLTRHSPGPTFNKTSSDLLPTSHGLITNQPGPSALVPTYSPPSSSRKKKKKEKKEKKEHRHREHRHKSKKSKHKSHKSKKKHKSHK